MALDTALLLFFGFLTKLYNPLYKSQSYQMRETRLGLGSHRNVDARKGTSLEVRGENCVNVTRGWLTRFRLGPEIRAVRP